jgi:hypothetical protein
MTDFQNVHSITNQRNTETEGDNSKDGYGVGTDLSLTLAKSALLRDTYPRGAGGRFFRARTSDRLSWKSIPA